MAPTPTSQPPRASPTTEATGERFRIVGYVTDWDAIVGQIPFDKLTHINYAFLVPNPDGTFQALRNPWKLREVVTQAHAQGVKVLISVGGWGWDDEFEQMAADPQSRAKFVQELDRFVRAFELDGADIDWEYPDPGSASAQNFLNLMQELEAVLRPQGRLLTAAVVASGSTGSGVRPEVFELVDFLNLMAYDGPPPHHSPYSYAEEALNYWSARGLPPEKMVLGVPFYSRPGEVPYRKLVRSSPEAASADEWEYLGSLQSYNGLPTIRQKTDLARRRASGIMIWTLAHDTMDDTSLLNAIYERAHSLTPAEEIGAGFRYSTYGSRYDPGPAYWGRVGQEMAARFVGATPQAIWIVGNYAGKGAILTFPGVSDNLSIHFSPRDKNEEALTQFDQLGFKVWLQVEPGDAPVEELAGLLLEQYNHHPSVVGVGVDVEWFHSTGEAGGRAVTDEEAASWLSAVRAHNSRYRLFLKHWQIEMMPPTLRDGLLFVDDSQGHESLDELAAEFAAWGAAFAPAPVAFQYGYQSDRAWWKELSDPPGDIGKRLLAVAPNTEALFWVDFTVRQVFPP